MQLAWARGATLSSVPGEPENVRWLLIGWQLPFAKPRLERRLRNRRLGRVCFELLLEIGLELWLLSWVGWLLALFVLRQFCLLRLRRSFGLLLMRVLGANTLLVPPTTIEAASFFVGRPMRACVNVMVGFWIVAIAAAGGGRVI